MTTVQSPDLSSVQSKSSSIQNPPISPLSETYDEITPLKPKFKPSSESSITTPISSSKASRLPAVIGDGSFESILKTKAKNRKEKDEQTIAQLRVAINQMDASLSHEIKRRIEGSQNLQKECNRQVEEMERRLMTIMTDKMQLVTDRLGELDVKVEELNERLNEERAKIPADLEEKGKELKDMLQSFQNEFTVERRDRLTREGRIMKQLTDQANDMSDQWKKEISEREETVSKLTKQLTNHENNRAEADREFETLIERELKALREDVERETNERKIEDDEIVEALNRYTDNLQSSLLGNDD